MTLNRIVVDGKTSLPRQVEFTGDGITFRVTYEVDAAGWHASEMAYTETMREPLQSRAAVDRTSRDESDVARLLNRLGAVSST